MPLQTSLTEGIIRLLSIRFEQAPDAGCVPTPIFAGLDAALVYLLGNLPQCQASVAEPLGHGIDAFAEVPRLAGPSSINSRDVRGRAPEFLAVCLRGRQRFLGPDGSSFALVLGHGRHDVQRELVGFRHIAGYEIHAALHQVRDKGGIPRQPVQLGDDEGRLMLPAQGEGLEEFRPVGAPAGLHVLERRQDFPPVGNVPLNCRLGFQPQVGTALLVGRLGIRRRLRRRW